MKRVLISASVLALAVTGISQSYAGTSDGQGAQKRGLFVTPGDGMSCDPAAEASPKSDTGFVILNAPGKEGEVSKINGEVSLKEGDAGKTYIVELAMVRGENDPVCTPVGELTTNDQGNGNEHINMPLMDGLADMYFVVLRDANQRFASSPVALR